MASTYTALLRIELQTDGENSGTWGAKEVNAHQMTEDAIAGTVDVPFTNVNVTLTANNGISDQARKMILKATGILSADVAMIVPLVSKIYVVNNATTGAFALTVRGATGTGVIVPTGKKAILICDGTNVDHVITDLGVTGPIGKQTLWIPAAAIRPSTTGGCATITTIATSANQPDIQSLDFDATTQEYAQFSVALPKQWNEGTVTAQFFWTHAATTVNFGVVWDLQAVAQSNGDAIAAAYGTAQIIADTGGTTNYVYVSDEVPAITIAGTPAEGDIVHYRLSRVTGNASDTMAIDARFLGMKLFVTTNAGNDV